MFRSLVFKSPRGTQSLGTQKNGLPFFDADQFSNLLIKEGFSPAQSRTVIHALDDVVNESIITTSSDLVTKDDQQKTIQGFKQNFSRLKSEIQQKERRDVDEIKTMNDQLKSEIAKLRKSLQQEIVRSQAGVRLDLNLEKGRIRDESINQHKRLEKTDQKMEEEIKALRGQMRGIKLQILQYLMGTITGGGTLVLGYIHFAS
ncbi:hypothetical protein J3Q64DRAFT_1774342 [Phycomyces blakesleeanus]|uniref:DUF1640 domain-containing protein n=2 Tax=Phycomyces blakesleeanus TaxID=4837 RepID=A0A163EJL0_PHYB8|nr:hypothetical protein PHYBLDRAFT_164027 [Phycomyces blakesleeanus NRRL 1555(-)]OAD78930.1 hypothetical protein PHYBLDRAFT_164027 [Phycomyces blakesleeanus NRRL 1555(-)]|eukprot:XP_018296970.1 hypothetical protein PHYBLDRAFT_164027 [Phycomyces blakesleeanus NRRL 1555(-)]